MTTVANVMTRGVRSMRPDDNLVAAAQAMEELNVGAVPVCSGDKLLGMLTDRDIVVRGVAKGLDLRQCKLSDVMSGHVHTAREDDAIQDVLHEMATAQIRRLPVVDSQDRLVGIVSLGDIAAKQHEGRQQVAESLGDISTPAAPDRSGHAHASGAQGGVSARAQHQPG